MTIIERKGTWLELPKMSCSCSICRNANCFWNWLSSLCRAFYITCMDGSRLNLCKKLSPYSENAKNGLYDGPKI